MPHKRRNPGGKKKKPTGHRQEREHDMESVTGNIRITGEVETHFPPNLENERKADNERKHAREDKRFIVEIVTAILILVYAGFTLWQSISARSSANAAKEAANAAMKQAQTSADQLALSERPWISSDVIVTSPFTFDVNGANLSLEFALRNSGLTPATQVSAFARFVAPPGPGNGGDIKKTVCNEAIEDGHISEITIFPATEVKEDRKFYASSEEITRFMQHGQLSLDVAVCIAYRSTVDRTAQYTTDGQIFTFARKGAEGETYAFIPGENVPISQLIFKAAGQNELLVGAGKYQIIPGDPSQISANAEGGPINITLPKIRPNNGKQEK
jgi:hypothetical protein